MADSSGRSLEDIMSSENVPEQLKDAIIAQEARYVKLKSSNATRNEIYEAYYKLNSLTKLLITFLDELELQNKEVCDKWMVNLSAIK